MDEQAVLQHLVEIENRAAQIVKDAENEAARLLAESDRVARLQFEADFAREYGILEDGYRQRVAEIDAAYQNELAVQRKALADRKPDFEKFSALAREFLCAEGGQPGV